MAQVSLPYTLTAGTPENVNNLVANLNALVAGVNTVDTAQLASGSVTTAKIADDAVTAAKIKDGEVGIVELAAAVGNFGAWTSYTPSMTNVTVGNGTREGAYCQIGKTVVMRASFVMGSTSAVTGGVRFSLPVTAANQVSGPWWATIVDSGTTTYSPFVQLVTTSAVSVYVQRVDGTYSYYSDTSATIPMTWTTNDGVYVAGVYEAA